MPLWVELTWCGLFLLLAFAPKPLGVRGAVLLTLIAGVGPRIYASLATVGTLWMLGWIQWIVVVAFSVMTVLWIVFLVLLWRGRPVQKLASVMARLAVIESAAILNSSAGLIISLVLGEMPRSVLRPTVALVYAVAQIVFFFRMSKGAL